MKELSVVLDDGGNYLVKYEDDSDGLTFFQTKDENEAITLVDSILLSYALSR